MKKLTKSVVQKEIVFSFSTITYLEAEAIDPHRSLRMNGVSNRCNNDLLQQQENDWYDDED